MSRMDVQGSYAAAALPAADPDWGEEATGGWGYEDEGPAQAKQFKVGVLRLKWHLKCMARQQSNFSCCSAWIVCGPLVLSTLSSSASAVPESCSNHVILALLCPNSLSIYNSVCTLSRHYVRTRCNGLLLHTCIMRVRLPCDWTSTAAPTQSWPSSIGESPGQCNLGSAPPALEACADLEAPDLVVCRAPQATGAVARPQEDFHRYVQR